MKITIAKLALDNGETLDSLEVGQQYAIRLSEMHNPRIRYVEIVGLTLTTVSAHYIDDEGPHTIIHITPVVFLACVKDAERPQPYRCSSCGSLEMAVHKAGCLWLEVYKGRKNSPHSIASQYEMAALMDKYRTEAVVMPPIE